MVKLCFPGSLSNIEVECHHLASLRTSGRLVSFLVVPYLILWAFHSFTILWLKFFNFIMVSWFLSRHLLKVSPFFMVRLHSDMNAHEEEDALEIQATERVYCHRKWPQTLKAISLHVLHPWGFAQKRVLYTTLGIAGLQLKHIFYLSLGISGFYRPFRMGTLGDELCGF